MPTKKHWNHIKEPNFTKACRCFHRWITDSYYALIWGFGNAMSFQLLRYVKQSRWSEVIELCKLDPHLATIRDKHGYTALHYVIIQLDRRESRGVNSIQVIKLLLDINPDATLMRATNGWTPLHHAVYLNFSSDVIKLFLNAKPEAANVRSSDGETPLFLCRLDRKPLSLWHQNFEKDNPWSVLLRFNDEWRTVQLLIKASCHKTVGTLPKDHKFRLLHAACSILCPSYILHMVLLLLPQESSEKDEVGNFPFSLFVSKEYTINCLPFYYDRSALEFNFTHLLNLNISAARSKDKYGRLPIHWVVINETCNLFVRELTEKYPEGIAEVDPMTGLFPFMLAASTGSYLENIYLLLKINPQVLNSQEDSISKI